MESHPVAPRPQPPRAKYARGFSLLETAMVVLLVGGAIAVGTLVLQARKPVRQVQAQEQALQWADQALVAYAAANAHLPCPVNTPTSDVDDCVAPNQKGWLPTRALEAVHPGGSSPGQPLRYMVYRGGAAGSDLAVASNQFSPHNWKREAHDFADINGLDLCAIIANAARESTTAVKADRARTTDIDGNAINVAYGLSVAGATPGDNGLFDGLNQQSVASMESPARGADSGYDDRVRVREFNALAQTLGCHYADAANPDGVVLASLDMLALAVDVSDEVDDQHEGNIEDTELAVKMAATSEFFAILNVALAAANISNSASTLATASTQLASAIASCVVLVGCALIPPYTAAVVAGGVAVGLSSAATALAAGALAAASSALAKTIIARDMAKEPIPRGPADLAGIIEQTCLASDGGWRLWDVDPVTKLRVPVPPPGIWQDGLLQQVQQIEQQIAEVELEIADADRRLQKVEQYRIPWSDGWLIDINYGKPVRGAEESEEDYNARYNQWLSGQSERVQEWERVLRVKLEAIRKAEDAHYEWDRAVQDEEDAAKALSDMNLAILELQGQIAACTITPPPTREGVIRCDNSRNSLAGLLNCDSEYTTLIDHDDDDSTAPIRQCLVVRQQVHDSAVATRQQAYNDYAALQSAAVNLSSPPMINYIEQTGWCGWDWGGCQALIIPWQSDDDKRETYARTYYQRKHLQVSLDLKNEELANKRAAYDKAHAQCLALQNMNPATGSGQTLPVWAGANAVLRGANCLGASGPVNPIDCGVPLPEATP